MMPFRSLRSIVVFLIVVTMASCSIKANNGTKQANLNGYKDEICFAVASAQDHRPLPNTKVSVIYRHSPNIKGLGTTDLLGTVCTSKLELRDAIVVLFDHEAHFVGALPVTPRLIRSKRNYIELAVFAVQ